jgi:hypothetical protein
LVDLQQITYVTFETALAQEQREGDLLEPTIITDNVWNKSPLEVMRKIEAVDASGTSAQEIIEFIYQNLLRRSPFDTGRYMNAHTVLYNGKRVTDFSKVFLTAANDTLMFTNPLPYAKKIEQGLSNQAPRGVYRLTAHRANNVFRRLIRVKFTYRPMSKLGEAMSGVPKGFSSSNLQVLRRIDRRGNKMARPTKETHVYPVIMVWPQLVGLSSKRPSRPSHAKMRWSHGAQGMKKSRFGQKYRGTKRKIGI